ncbi:MAG: hypothetical protein SGJ27_21200 [Candidatus Melainabacteria bacterium]|nr:hypothetical protein [Candidatus Melainabacteria bacterium]
MVLVVIDCQPRYLPFGATLEALADEVKTAKAAGMPIIFLEYHTAEPTYEHIMDLVIGYDKFEVRRKGTFGGGKEVIGICKSKGWDLSHARLVGACTYCCVSETSEQLLAALPETTQDVVVRAVYDTYVGGPFPRHENIRWV